MRAIQVRQPGGLDKLEVVSLPEPSTPGKGEILVRFHASSLNFHDYLIVSGKVPTEDKRIPMSDGAGEVLAVGEGVEEFQVGDKVISLFFPNWIAGDPPNVSLPRTFAHVPGDGADGCARDMMTAPAGCFTRAPRGGGYRYPPSDRPDIPFGAAFRCLSLSGVRGAHWKDCDRDMSYDVYPFEAQPLLRR